MSWIGPSGPRVPGEMADDRIERLEAQGDRYRALHPDDDGDESQSWPKRTLSRIRGLLTRRSSTPGN